MIASSFSPMRRFSQDFNSQSPVDTAYSRNVANHTYPLRARGDKENSGGLSLEIGSILHSSFFLLNSRLAVGDHDGDGLGPANHDGVVDRDSRQVHARADGDAFGLVLPVLQNHTPRTEVHVHDLSVNANRVDNDAADVLAFGG